MAPPGSPFTADDKGVTLTVRLTPKAGRDAILGCIPDGDGTALKVHVTAPPVGGKANAALIKLLAKKLHHPRTRITVVRGATGRRKVLRLTGDPADLRRRLAVWTG